VVSQATALGGGMHTLAGGAVVKGPAHVHPSGTKDQGLARI